MQLLDTRRHDPHEVGVRERLLELDSALHINVQKRDLLFILDACNLRFCGAVEVFVDLTVLNEFVLGDHAFKFFPGDEEVLSSMDLTFSWLPGRVGYAESKIVLVFACEVVNKRAFASTRRAHNHKWLVVYLR